MTTHSPLSYPKAMWNATHHEKHSRFNTRLNIRIRINSHHDNEFRSLVGPKADTAKCSHALQQPHVLIILELFGDEKPSGVFLVHIHNSHDSNLITELFRTQDSGPVTKDQWYLIVRSLSNRLPVIWDVLALILGYPSVIYNLHDIVDFGM